MKKKETTEPDEPKQSELRYCPSCKKKTMQHATLFDPDEAGDCAWPVKIWTCNNCGEGTDFLYDLE